MRSPSFYKRLTLAVSLVIIGSLVTTVLVNVIIYHKSMHQMAISQAESLARAIELASDGHIPSSERAILNKLLEDISRCYSSVAYLFITHEDEILAQPFAMNIPEMIKKANLLENGQTRGYIHIQNEQDEQYFDIALALPKFRDSILRIGFSEKFYLTNSHRKGLRWLLFSSIGIWALAVMLTLLLTRKMTAPLRHLAREFENLEKGALELHHPEFKYWEIEKLALSAGNLAERFQSCTQNIEDRTVELENAYRRFFSSFEIIRMVGTHATLKDVCSYLLGQFTEMLDCEHLAMVLPGKDQNFVFEEGRLKIISREQFETVWTIIRDAKNVVFVKNSPTSFLILDEKFKFTHRVGIFPVFYENRTICALLVGCPKGCQCHFEGLKIIYLILQECAGALNRAINSAEDLQRIDCRIELESQFCGIVGRDRRMQTVYKLIEEISPTDAAVLIQGESGTGKELVASAIHEKSLRKNMPFVVINCSAYPASLLESELFGHEKGAFTGAIRKKIGRFEQADGGTVFLDEIGEIAPSAQIKLLRVLQTQTFERIGGEQTVHVHVRIIAATNKDLTEAAQNGSFREDLFYRLNVIPIYLPPLRERKNDIPLLARHFLAYFNSEQGKSVKDFRTDAMRLLLEYTWPGNIRELKNTIEHAVVLTKNDHVDVAALPSSIQSTLKITKGTLRRKSLIENEKKLYQEILEETGWNKKLAAKRLGISRSTLYNKIKKYRLTPPAVH